DGIADMGRDLRGRISDLIDPDLDSFGACRSRHGDKKERAEAPTKRTSGHSWPLFEFCSDVFGVLLVTLKDLQASAEQIPQLLVAGRRNERGLQRIIDGLVISGLIFDVGLVESVAAQL